MASTKVAVTIEDELVAQVDRRVGEGQYPNRSKAIQVAVREKLEGSRKRRLAREAATLDPKEERALAEEGFESDAKTCPAY